MTNVPMLCAAGFAAGAMNSLAGGGSFVTLPALIAAGVPSVQANASSTVALFPGGITGTWAYRRGLGPVGGISLPAMVVTTAMGGALGALLLMTTSSRAFDFVLPWLLLLATAALSLGRRVGNWLRARTEMNRGIALVIQFALGVYGGYFGGAVGIMMVAIWGLLDPRDLKSLNAPRTLMVTAANTAAVITFSLVGAVHWPETLVMLAGAVVGGYVGAHIGRRLPEKVTRGGTLIVTLAITLAFFVRAYG